MTGTDTFGAGLGTVGCPFELGSVVSPPLLSRPPSVSCELEKPPEVSCESLKPPRLALLVSCARRIVWVVGICLRCIGTLLTRLLGTSPTAGSAIEYEGRSLSMGNGRPIRGFECVSTLQVHLPDFKLDNSTFRRWQDDPSNMCDSLARFASYDKLDPTLCPEIFSPAPPYGKNLPLNTVSACTPAAKDSTTDPGICEDDRFMYQERYDIIRMYDQMCHTNKSWYKQCKESLRNKCPSGPPKRRSLLGSRSSSSYWPLSSLSNPKHRRTSSDHSLESQFEGVLVKSHDITQSAVEVCQSSGSVGPDFYSEPEHMFCDMKTRMLYPGCNATIETACFDPIQNETRIETEDEETKKRSEQRTYVEVKDWS